MAKNNGNQNGGDTADGNECKDIAEEGVYPALARALMPEMHSNALELLGEGLAKFEGPRTLVVVGPGREVLPYSGRRKELEGLLNGGNVVLMDYNESICNDIPAYLALRGFGEGFSIKKANGEFNPSEGNNTIFVQARNIMGGYSFPDESVSAIDMTVAVHHATQYESDILDFWKEAYRVLVPGGVLQIGEGNVDMKRNERKLKKIAQDLIDSGKEGVIVVDARYDHNGTRQHYFGNGTAPAVVYIGNEGMVRVTNVDADKTAEHLAKAGYKQMLNVDGSLVMPYIDHAMEEDFQGLIVPVRNYYSAIIKDTLGGGLPESKHDKFMEAITKEQSDAERGLVEFYSLPDMLIDNMKKAGFNLRDARYTSHGPFANILAEKPVNEAMPRGLCKH